MEEDCFIDAAEKLQLVNDKFNYLVNHPPPDLITSPAFQKKVVELAVNSSFVFCIVANNTYPASDAKFLTACSQPSVAEHAQPADLAARTESDDLCSASTQFDLKLHIPTQTKLNFDLKQLEEVQLRDGLTQKA
eukprot:2263852-Rhodomonas_salina.1